MHSHLASKQTCDRKQKFRVSKYYIFSDVIKLWNKHYHFAIQVKHHIGRHRQLTQVVAEVGPSSHCLFNLIFDSSCMHPMHSSRSYDMIQVVKSNPLLYTRKSISTYLISFIRSVMNNLFLESIDEPIQKSFMKHDVSQNQYWSGKFILEVLKIQCIQSYVERFDKILGILGFILISMRIYLVQ